jgi:cobalt-zinc-cadmium efflux system membrane fusion protein
LNRLAFRSVWLVTLAAAACHHDHDGGHGHGQEEEEAHDDAHGHGHGPGGTAVTHFTEGTELFVEFPPLVVGHDAEPAAHVTTLPDWRAATTGTMTVTLSSTGAPAEEFTVTDPAVPGIFRPVIQPVHAGNRTVEIRVAIGGSEYIHPCGELMVYPDAATAAAAPATPEPQTEDISFLKEQAWKIDFALSEVETRAVRPSFESYGTLRARSDGEAHVTAPVSGRLVAGAAFPRIGLEVKAGQVLSVLTPRLADVGDAAALSQAVAEAGIAVRKAAQARKRLEGLLTSGAIPERRVIDGRYAEEQARQTLATAQRRQGQARRFNSTGGSGAGAVSLRAPMSGTLVAVNSAPGAFVEEGAHLFRIVDLARLWLEVHVVETHAALLDNPQGVWFEVDGMPKSFQAGPDAVVAAGGELDAHSRTVPLLVEVDNTDRKLRVGMFADVRVITGEPSEQPTVPISAVVWEAGLPVVYAQTGGESFARRVVRLGQRDGRHMAVRSGVSAGERVVSTGAYAVRLAGFEPAVAGHGHPH